MDSVTQAVFGAAVGGAVLGRRMGWRAFAWGAALGTLPDLDSLVPYGGPVEDFTYHRGYSHSLVVLTAAAPVLALALAHGHRARAGPGFVHSLLATWLVLITHALLDAFTIYGTQLWLPFTDYPVGLGSIFIIDPLYTLPLLIGIGGALVLRGRWQRARLWNGVGLAIAVAYLAWTVGAQQWAEARARAAIDAQGLAAERVLATPTAFNSLLWRIVAVGDDAHWEGFLPVGSDRPVRFTRHARETGLLEGIRDRWAVQRLQAFTKGFYSVNERGEGEVVITDLRMGQAGFYAFAFIVGERRGETTDPVTVRRYDYGRPPLAVVARDLFACGRGRATEVLRC